MGDLRDLYQEMVLDHGKKPRNHCALPDSDGRAEGFNPLCGDRLTVYVRWDGNRISKVTFEGIGCAISQASASIMTQTLVGKTREEVETLFHSFHDLMTGSTDSEPDEDALGKLVVLAGVRDFPVRVKCATLAWHTLRAALEDHDAPVTTE